MKKTRRILAVAAIVFLLGMYLVCFILALTGKHEAGSLFRAALGATIAVPIVLYAFLMLLRLFPPFVKNEEDEADVLTENDEESRRDEEVSDPDGPERNA